MPGDDPTLHPIAQTINAAANTPVGGTAIMTATNIGSSYVGNQTIGAPEIPLLGWCVTYITQIVKQHPKFNQNSVALMCSFLVLCSFGIGFLVWRDVVKAIEGAGMIAWTAQQNYHQWQLTGFGGLTPAGEDRGNIIGATSSTASGASGQQANPNTNVASTG